MANLVELFDNIVQMQNLNGVPLANGKLYVYALGRTRLMDTWSDVDGESLNTNPIILDDAGQAHCFVSDDFDYTLVVKDAYDNEIFSIDKYLYSKGEHSHADVAVAPSEHIGVSSYHVGETTVYVPYIQGELGKTYHGIEPIVVNNQENKISARNIPLGVQSPLYFAEDSESACIIGMSGEYQPVTGMSGYATTGDLVDLATSVSETYQPKGDYATHDDLSGFMEESKLETADGKITGYDGTAFAGGGSVDPSEFIPWSASGNFATSGDLNDKLDTTAFSTVSGDFITAIPDTYASKDFVLSSVSSKLDNTAFSTVSGDFITALPEGLLNESGFEYDGDKISAYNGSAFVGQGGGGITGEYELSAGNGISIDNYPIEQKTVISVSGDYITKNSADTLYYGIDNPSGFITGVDLTPYQTTAGMTAYQPVGDYLTTGDSANFYTTANESGFITGVDLTPYQTVEGMTAYQEAGDYYSASNPSGFITGVDLSDYATTAEVADKQDITGMTAYQPVGDYYSASNPSGFITGVDLTPYQLTADMTAYQPVGDYMTTGDSANFYTTANESGFISDVPAGTMNESAFGYDASDNITAYNGSAFKAGDEFPQSATEAIETVTANSADWNGTTETVSSNSGVWGGSALPISAGPGIKFEMVDNTLVASTDETILFNGNISGQLSDFTTIEPITNFNKLNVYIAANDAGSTILGGNVITYDTSALSAQNVLSIGGSYTISNGYTCFYNLFYQVTDSTAFAKTVNKRFWINPASAIPVENHVSYNPTATAEQLKNGYIYKIVGVDRIGGN